LGTTYRVIMSGEASGGTMSVVDSLSPSRSGPPRHIHQDADEAFVILTGECEFWLERKRFTAGPGETVCIPRGREHTFRVVSDHPCRHLVILTPGGFEGFFVEMAKHGYRIPDDMGSVIEAGKRFHLDFTGPPLEDE
jgi:mannose-6-phosphate isomerase-like protein (cupin superfamily)